MKPLHTLRTLLALTSFALVFAACEDPAPTEYIPEYVVEAFLIVGDPIDGIRITRSQSVADTFRYRNSAISDADVRLKAGDTTYQLRYRANDGVGEYYLPDTTTTVQPLTNYELVVTTSDGTTITGSTRTPEEVRWIREPHGVIQYPTDTINLANPPDSLSLAWTPVTGVTEYLIAVRCLDTLGYGRYLDPPTEETNRRIERFFNAEDPRYDEVTRIGFIQASGVPLVWYAFKWFGLHEVTVYASDVAFVNWYKMTYWQRPPTYEPLLGNVKGGLGVVASASVARKQVFMRKNQP